MVRSKLPNIRIRSGFLGAIIFGSAIAAIAAVGRGLAAGEKRSCIMEGQSEVKVGMCVLIHGLETRKDLNDRWGEVLKKCDGMDPERFLVKVFDPDLGFGRGDWSTETVRIKTVNLEESLIGPTTHEGMACGHSNPRHDGSFCDEKLVASQILHGDEDMLSWPEIKEKWGSCVNFALKHGFDPMDWDRFDELRELSTRIKAKRQKLAREERARREREMESQRRTPPDNGRIDLVVEGEAANGAAPAAPAAAVENEIKAFIGGLASWVTEEHLKEEFEKYGIVGANVKRLKNGRSRGFGFVSFWTVGLRQKAVERLHGKMFWGKEITVAPAKPRDRNAPRPRRGRGTKHSRGRGADQGPHKYTPSKPKAPKRARKELLTKEQEKRIRGLQQNIRGLQQMAQALEEARERELREKRILGVLQKEQQQEQQLAQVYELLEWARERGM